MLNNRIDDFIEFIKLNTNIFDNILIKFYNKYCPQMKENDNKFDISKLLLKIMKDYLHDVFEECQSDGYDCKIEVNNNIYLVSLKTSVSKNIYQRNKINLDGKTLPKTIILSNKRGENNNNNHLINVLGNFDYLIHFGVFSGNKSDTIPVYKWSVISKNKITNNNIVQSNTDTRIRIYDNEWDYLSNNLILEKKTSKYYTEREKIFKFAEDMKYKIIIQGVY